MSLLLAALIAGAATPNLESRARAALMYELKDPGSAQFAELREVGTGKLAGLCGKVNAKNAHGGYVGFRDFAAIGGTVVIAGDPDTGVRKAEQDVVDHFCKAK